MSFVDTNVLVFATAEGAPFQDKARAALIGFARTERLSISRQILREYVAVMTRPQTWGRPVSLTEAVADATVFADRFDVLEDGPDVWRHFVELSRDHAFAGRQVHDAARGAPVADLQYWGLPALWHCDRVDRPVGGRHGTPAGPPTPAPSAAPVSA